MSETYRILGIDPGFGRVGWGVIEGKKDRWTHIAHGCIETDASLALVDRLAVITKELSSIITTYQPQQAAVEELFFNKNITTGIQVAQARGVILLTLHQKGIVCTEVTPSQVKQSLTGYGKADKQQVQKMVSIHLSMSSTVKQDDAADALAVAITASMHAPS